MAGSNGIIKLELTNREGEIIPHLKTRGTNFFSLSANSVLSTATLTPDQAMQDLLITGAGAGTITWPASAAVLANSSAIGLLTNYFNTTNSGWTVTLVNQTAANETLVFPANFIVSSTYSLTLAANSARTTRFLIQGANIFVY